jgi:hypothetical protein
VAQVGRSEVYILSEGLRRAPDVPRPVARPGPPLMELRRPSECLPNAR